ncbi:hemerythrin domain-containing protein [Granulicoccus phenolivorans]|uniref:hemerythrin domain-containing protein n=1 Tax=Granulicoccus phenolivorans TaxID=266854 RepID=UPI00047924FC|nr:hemerythrin domain-containing protein [Granulicoccus phenolivorans]
MTEGDPTRLVAWSQELRTVHERLREALQVTRDAVAAGESAEPAARELLLYCRGFCRALTDHHLGEDRLLFPAIAEAHPGLQETLRYLMQDHSMIAYLVTAVQEALGRASGREIDRHLEGIAAIMESHFAYEERQLLTVLDALALSADPATVLGPL